MKERPILFSALMVRALRAGLKSQTRRAVKGDFENFEEGWSLNGGDPRPTRESWSPYGQPGDRLWVQEEHAVTGNGAAGPDLTVRYAVDGLERSCEVTSREYELFRARKFPFAPTRGRFMYRSLSRITLEILEVRVERLQAITRGDAMAEGCPFPNLRGGDDPRQWYRELWEKLNGPGSWDLNPWVWVVEFKRVEVAS